MTTILSLSVTAVIAGMLIISAAAFQTLIDWLDEREEHKLTDPLIEICKGRRCAGYHPQSLSDMYINIAAADTAWEDRTLWIDSARAVPQNSIILHCTQHLLTLLKWS